MAIVLILAFILAVLSAPACFATTAVSSELTCAGGIQAKMRTARDARPFRFIYDTEGTHSNGALLECESITLRSRMKVTITLVNTNRAHPALLKRERQREPTDATTNDRYQWSLNYYWRFGLALPCGVFEGSGRTGNACE